MRNTRKVVVAAIVAVLSLSSAFTDQEPRIRRPLPVPKRLVSMSVPRRVAGIGIGKPSTFSMLDSWITSNLLACGAPPCDTNSEFLTDILWLDDEILSIVVSFYSATTREVTLTVQVKSESGAIVFTDGFTQAPPEPDALNYTVFPLNAPLASGAYKVIFKAKQSGKVVGTQYWINVFQDLD